MDEVEVQEHHLPWPQVIIEAPASHPTTTMMFFSLAHQPNEPDFELTRITSKAAHKLWCDNVW